MPTGYTAPVADGEIADFKTFALRCARAFGALVSMRDEPLSVPIPETIEPSRYHADKLIELRERQMRLERMTTAEIESAAQAAWDKAQAYHEQSKVQYATQRAAYDKMLVEVTDWHAPTTHREFKDFMLQQLRDSLRSDCPGDHDTWSTPPKALTAMEWWANERASVAKGIGYHTEEWGKALTRAAEANEWLSALRKSLEG